MLSLLISTAFAVSPLILAADMAAPDLEVWWRDGEILAGSPGREGRPGVRPLVDIAPIAMPRDLGAFTQLGRGCAGPLGATFKLDALEVEAEMAGTPEEPVIQLRAGQRLLAASGLQRPMHVCAVHVVQADALPGLEVVVVWQPPENLSNLGGLTVFHIPDLAR